MIDLWAAGLKPGSDPKPVDNNEVEIARQWLRKFTKKRASIRKRESSYTLKNYVRNWSGVYVSNGAFIKAALLEGYAYEPIHDNDPFNAFFNISLPRKRSAEYYESGIGSR